MTEACFNAAGNTMMMSTSTEFRANDLNSLMETMFAIAGPVLYLRIILTASSNVRFMS